MFGAASYRPETMVTMTNDHLLESGVISDPLVYLEKRTDYQVRGNTTRCTHFAYSDSSKSEANSNAENSNES